MPDAPPLPVVRPRPRIESLSDLIFGLALSVGSLALVATLPKTSGQLLSDIGTFGFTFLILISVWSDYTRIMSVLPLEEPRIVMLNTLLLFTVSLEPFLFILLNSSGLTPSYFLEVSQVYAGDLGVMMVVLGAFAATVATDLTVPLEPLVRRNLRRESVTRFGVGAVFFVSILPIFGQYTFLGLPVRILLWFIALANALRTRWRRSSVLVGDADPS